MTQEDPSRKTPSPKGHSDTWREKARCDFAEALERGESPCIEDSLGDASGAERDHLLQSLLCLELGGIPLHVEDRAGPHLAPDRRNRRLASAQGLHLGSL